MKKLIFLLITANLAYAVPHVGRYYLGFGYKHSFISGRNDYKNMFAENHPGGHVWVGYQPFQYFRFELGYDWTTRNARHYHIPVGSTFAGLTNTTVPTTITGRIRFKNTYFDSHLLFMGESDYNGYLILGISNGRPHILVETMPRQNTPYNQLSGTKGYSRPFLRAGLGLEFLFNESWGFRANVLWENTRRLRFRNPPYAAQSLLNKEKLFSNGTSVGFGFYYLI